MRRKSVNRWWVVIIAASVGILFAVFYFKIHALSYYWVTSSLRDPQTNSAALDLSTYVVTIDGASVKGINQNLSGLTYSKHSETLFSVINKPPKIIEISKDGKLLRAIPIVGLSDVEGITHVEGEDFILSEESSQQIYRVQITEKTLFFNKAEKPKLGLSLDFRSNKGFEGVSWDSTNQRLWVAKEKSPLRVITILGLLDAFNGKMPFNLQISEWKNPQARSLFMTDLSSISFVEKTGTLLLLSEESSLLVEYSEEGDVIGILPLWRGFRGLANTVPQPEGVAVGSDREIYVISEPNLLYRFDPQ